IKRWKGEREKMHSLNLVGRLTKDGDVTGSESGTHVAKLIVADTRPFAYGGKRHAESITAVACGKVALNLAKYCGKGSQISREGKVQSFSYDKNGETKFGMNVVANNIQFLSHPQNDQEQGQDKNNSDEPSGDSSSFEQAGEPIDGSDLPF